MIVMKIELMSAVTGKTSVLGTLVIDNLSGGGAKRDYRCQMFKKTTKDLLTQMTTEKPIREARVMGHRAIAEPVQNLVLKSLLAMGYKSLSS